MSNNSLLLPPQKVTAGTTDPRGAANLKAEQQVQTTMKLTGKSGGRRRHSKKSGGATGTIQVAPLAGAAVTPEANAANLQIQQLHANSVAQSEYDNKAKIGGSWPKWTCLSGGLKRSSKRSKRSSKRSKRSKRSKKSRKHRR